MTTVEDDDDLTPVQRLALAAVAPVVERVLFKAQWIGAEAPVGVPIDDLVAWVETALGGDYAVDLAAAVDLLAAVDLFLDPASGEPVTPPDLRKWSSR
jgi:hypothetical protein